MLGHSERKLLVDFKKEEVKISLKRQTEILSISRSSLYYQPAPISAQDKVIIDLIDQIYTDKPFYGKRRICWDLNNVYHISIGVKHTRTLMQTIGLEAIYPKKKKNLSSPGKGHQIYPYLLRNLEIVRSNQVWSTDITYIKLKSGFCYLIAIVDWYSRLVVGWKLSNTLEMDFCLEVYEEAIKKFGAPEIMNTDQGSHFTSPRFIQISLDNNTQISMDGRGRCLDNIFVERLWRSVKQENIYRLNYENVLEVRIGLKKYFEFYNNERPHQSLNYQFPNTVYYQNNNSQKCQN